MLIQKQKYNINKKIVKKLIQVQLYIIMNQLIMFVLFVTDKILIVSNVEVLAILIQFLLVVAQTNNFVNFQLMVNKLESVNSRWAKSS